MGAKAFISLGEVYEIFIQVTTTDEYSINQRNAVTILDELVKHAIRDNACWEIKVKMDYEDAQSSAPTANEEKTGRGV